MRAKGANEWAIWGEAGRERERERARERDAPIGMNEDANETPKYLRLALISQLHSTKTNPNVSRCNKKNVLSLSPQHNP